MTTRIIISRIASFIVNILLADISARWMFIIVLFIFLAMWWG